MFYLFYTIIILLMFGKIMSLCIINRLIIQNNVQARTVELNVSRVFVQQEMQATLHTFVAQEIWQ